MEEGALHTSLTSPDGTNTVSEEESDLIEVQSGEDIKESKSLFTSTFNLFVLVISNLLVILLLVLVYFLCSR